MANPVLGSVVSYHRPDGETFNALVLADQGPGFIDLAYVDTTASPAFVATVTAVQIVTPGANGYASS